MDLDFRKQLPDDFNADSRVWIYQSSRLFSLSEALEIEELLHQFIASWNSHGDGVKGYGNLFFGQFIILMADESSFGVSGCSTDTSVHFVKNIAQRFNVELFDRQTLAFLVKGKVQLLPLSQLPYAIENGFITDDSIYFNNTVLTKKEMEDRWLIEAGKSWLKNRFSLSTNRSSTT